MKHGIFRALLLSAMLVSISVMACRKKITETAREQNGGTSSTQQNTKSNALDVLKIAFDTKAQVGDIVRIDDTFYVKFNKAEFEKDKGKIAIATLEVSPKAHATIKVGDSMDFSNENQKLNFLVEAEAGASKTYYVRAEVLQSDENKIEQFQIKSPIDQKILTGQIDQNNNTITLVVDAGTNTSFASAFAPSKIDISPNAKLDKEATQSQDFAKPVTYTVTSESGKTRQYTVNVRYRFQIPNGDFEQWYETSAPNPRVTDGNGVYQGLGPSRDNRGGWDSYNRGFWYTAKSGSNYPLRQTSGFNNQGKALLLMNSSYQNYHLAGRDYWFGLSPGMIFTGSLVNFTDTEGSTDGNNNFKRGTPQFIPLTFGKDGVTREMPKSFSFYYKYKPQSRFLQALRSTSSGSLAWNKSYEKQSTGQDKMEGYVMLLNAAGQVIAVGGIQDGKNTGDTWSHVAISFRTQTTTNEAERKAVQGKQWANGDKNPAKVQVMFSATSGWSTDQYQIIAGAGSELYLDNITLNY